MQYGDRLRRDLQPLPADIQPLVSWANPEATEGARFHGGHAHSVTALEFAEAPRGVRAADESSRVEKHITTYLGLDVHKKDLFIAM